MADLSKLALLVGVYGGLSLAGMAMALVGLRVAQRRSSVIAFAVAGGICVLLQAILLALLSSMGSAWGGDGDRVLTALSGLLVLISAATVAFLFLYKVERVQEAAPPDGSQTAAAWVTFYAIAYLVFAVWPLHGFYFPGLLTCLLIAGLFAAAWGLRHRYRWAWWLAVAGVSIGLLRAASALVLSPSTVSTVFSGLGVMALVQVVVLTQLLRKSTRQACVL